ncbi:hypothetical protein L0F63_002078, partial [Massospora cicadina]
RRNALLVNYRGGGSLQNQKEQLNDYLVAKRDASQKPKMWQDHLNCIRSLNNLDAGWTRSKKVTEALAGQIILWVSLSKALF